MNCCNWPPRIRDRASERALLGRQMAEEAAQTRAARQRLATGGIVRLSELGRLDRHAFALFLALLSEALAAATGLNERIERLTTDGSLSLMLEPIANAPVIELETELGAFAGRDHWIRIREVGVS